MLDNRDDHVYASVPGPDNANIFFDKQPERAYAAVSLAFPLLICQHLATHPCLSLQESVLSLSRTEVGYVGITYSFLSGKMKTVSDLIGSIPAISGCSFPIDVAA